MTDLITYCGEADPRQCEYSVGFFKNDEEVQELPWRLDLCNHSPTGLSWGYAGSGPAQLALAILAHATGNDHLAVRLHQTYKAQVIAHLPNEWAIPQLEVKRWVERQLQEEAMGPRRNPLQPIFRDHNCWRCKNGEQPCAEGNYNNCSYPHARND